MILLTPTFLNTYSKIFTDSTILNRDQETNPGGSALGAYINLAIISKALSETLTNTEVESLEAKLGTSIDSAFVMVQTLSKTYPNVVKFALAFWTNVPENFFYKTILQLVGSIDTAETGLQVPDEKAVNKWVAEKTMNLIDSIPLIYPMDGLLINAIATKISWIREFTVVNAPDNSSWDVKTLLKESTTAVKVYNVDGVRFAVHSKAGVMGQEKETVLVHSIVGEKDVPLSELNALFLKVNSDAETNYEETLDFWLTEKIATDFLTVSQEEGIDGGNKFTVTLPSWSSSGVIENEDLLKAGFGDVDPALKRIKQAVETKQVVVAKYSAVGYEAAAVTFSMMVRGSMPVRAKYLLGELNFNHPYLVVAMFKNGRNENNPWSDIPLFTHVVNTAEESKEEK